MQLPNYIQFPHDGTILILSTSPPHLIGKVIQFRSEDEMTDWVAKKKADTGRCIAGKVPYHSILIVFNGFLDGGFLLPESAIEFKNMAQWYFENRIEPNQRRFKKYLTEQSF